LLFPGTDIKSFEEAALCALRIKDEVKRQERITCSAGIGPNKLTAKIASKFRKPIGLSVVRPEDVQDFVFPLEVSKIPGINQKTTEALKLIEITRVEELVNCDIQRLTDRFGKMDLLLKQTAHGIDFSEIEESEEL
jgi:DNA polymerase IV (archaeal DinB-like DNA polymerase)